MRDDDATEVIARTDPEDLVLGRYRLLERVGTGGTADVWRARDERRDRTVTVKILRERDDPELRVSFLEEARVVDALRHPATVPVLEIQDTSAVTLIAFEHVEGETLASIGRTRGPLPAREVGVILLQLASVLEALHRHGFAHLDVKPANVLRESTGTVRLLDFGIAQRIGERPAVIRGTPRYLAPEVRSGAPVTGSSDVYGLALMARDLLGERPGTPRTEALVRRALDPEPHRRPRSPRSFALTFAAMALVEGEIATVQRALAWSAVRLPLRGPNLSAVPSYALIAALVAVLFMIVAGVASATAATTRAGAAIGAPPLAEPRFALPSLSAYDAAWEAQAPYPTVAAGGVVEWTVALRNTGSAGWYRGVRGAQASLAHADGTIAGVQTTDYVGPGQVGWFVVRFQAPASPGTYVVTFRPRIDGAGLLRDLGVHAILTVTADR